MPTSRRSLCSRVMEAESAGSQGTGEAPPERGLSPLVSRVVDSLMLLGSSRSSDQQVHYHEYAANQ